MNLPLDFFGVRLGIRPSIDEVLGPRAQGSRARAGLRSPQDHVPRRVARRGPACRRCEPIRCTHRQPSRYPIPALVPVDFTDARLTAATPPAYCSSSRTRHVLHRDSDNLGDIPRGRPSAKSNSAWRAGVASVASSESGSVRGIADPPSLIQSAWFASLRYGLSELACEPVNPIRLGAGGAWPDDVAHDGDNRQLSRPSANGQLTLVDPRQPTTPSNYIKVACPGPSRRGRHF